MTGDIVSFPQKERLIWICGCGCCTLFLHEDGSSECPSCGVMHAGNWAPPPDVKKVPVEVITTHKIGEPADISNQRFIKLLSDPDLLAATQFFRDGRVHSLIREREARTDAQKAWWRRRAVDFLRQVFL